jgi:membrane protease YdiL (CAAX protease family)
LRRVRQPWFDPDVRWAQAWDIWLIFLFLGAMVPWRGRVRLQELLARGEVCSRERVRLYLSTMGFQWAATGFVAWRAWAHGFTLGDLAMVRPGVGMLLASSAGAVAIGIFQWFNLRRVAKSGGRGDQMRRVAKAILPQSQVELVAFLGLAVTAAICEEFLYRGFSMAVLFRLNLPAFLVVLISSVLFGLAHLYQGRGGLVATMILGLAFGTLRMMTASLLPPIFCHSAVDIVAGIAGPRFLLRVDKDDMPVTTVQSITY